MTGRRSPGIEVFPTPNGGMRPYPPGTARGSIKKRRVFLKKVSVMCALMRRTVLVTMAGLIGLAGCGTVTASSPGAAKSPVPASSTPAPKTTSPSGTATPGPGSPVCPQAGSYLTAIRIGEQAGYDRVVFQFSGRAPAYEVGRVRTVYTDPKGTPVALAGQSFARVVFRASAVCPQPLGKTYTGPSTLTPFDPELLVVGAAGDFEGYLSFGIGLAAGGSYHAYPMTNPDRVVIDFSHVTMGTFPGIWPVTSWQQYWQLQYAWNNGHQPWQANPAMVVQAWTRGRWTTTPVIRQVDANTFKVTEPGGQVDTVTGTRPVSVPGPWVITTIMNGTA